MMAFAFDMCVSREIRLMKKRLYAPVGAMILAFGAAAAMAETPLQLNANKQLVLEFSRQVFEARDTSKAGNFLAEDVIDHNPNIPSGLKGFVETFDRMWKPGPRASHPETDPMQGVQHPPVAVVAEGDKVLVVLKIKRPDPDAPSKTYDSFWFDLYRIKNAKITEHWDGALKGAPP
jgi:predicted SnoaL-like aldol condensation-catalyzing enzyme